jgi:hypothetical protein
VAGRKVTPRKFEVLVSFSGLDKGEVFTEDGDDLAWAAMHVQSGYLRDVSEDVEVSNAGEVGQG